MVQMKPAVLFHLAIMGIVTVEALIRTGSARPDCLTSFSEECPLLSRSKQTFDWSDGTRWDVPSRGTDVSLPLGSSVFLSRCAMTGPDIYYSSVYIPHSSTLYVAEPEVIQKLGEVSGRVVLLTAAQCLSTSNEPFALIERRRLAGSTRSPTKVPTAKTTSPTSKATLKPSVDPDNNPPEEVTNVPTIISGPGNPALNISFSNNDAQAAATLAGTTLPFLGLGALLMGLYMRRQRSSSLSGPSDGGGSIIIGADGDQHRPHVSATNPAFENKDIADLEQGRTMETSTVEENKIIREAANNSTGKRKTMRSLMDMVIKSRETASFYISPLDQVDEESGLSKAQIEEKVKRQAAAGAVGFGAVTNTAALKPLSLALSQVRPEGHALLRPSDVMRGESSKPMGFPSENREFGSTASMLDQPASASPSNSPLSTELNMHGPDIGMVEDEMSRSE